MRDELASLVHPVFRYGLALKERLDRGEAPHLETEQAALVGLLTGEAEARRSLDFAGDQAAGAAARPPLSPTGIAGSGEVAAGQSGERRGGPFLGARYALVCWLDELFVLYTSWADAWSEHKLEVALYAGNDRAWRFWDQAKLAATRSADALEVYFLCVALGFRGELHEEAERLDEWFESTRGQLTRSLARDWAGPPELEPPMRVPRLHGRSRLRRMVLAAGAALLLLVPAVALFLVLMTSG
jgi:type VI secretion system protein ImpK